MQACLSMRQLLDESLCYGNSALFVREDKTEVSFKDFYNRVFAVARGMMMIHQRFIVISAKDPILYMQAYIGAVLSGHVACLAKPGDNEPFAFREIHDKISVCDEAIITLGSGSPDRSMLPDTDPDGISTIAISSGTASGRQKPIALSQRAILFDVAAAMEYDLYRPKMRCVHVLPYWHMFGIATELIAPLYSGATVCVPGSPHRFLSILKAFEPDFLNVPPALAMYLLERIKAVGKHRAVGERLFKLIVSGAGLNDNVFSDLTELGFKVLTAYGLTECSPCVSMMPEWDIRAHTSGRVIPGMTVQIADDGEIIVKGPSLMLGYYLPDGSLLSMLRDGWLHTGDLGRIDEEGYLSVIGRKSSTLVLASGKKYIPEEIEQRINVLEGVLESRLGLTKNNNEVIPELVVVCDGKNVSTQCINTVLKDFDLLPSVIRIQSDRLPRNEMGKLLR